MTCEVVTRFAPSPTGTLHIGNARSALFNWLFARNRKGRFLLRIEDTDHARSTPEARQTILDGLTWLGLEWDGEAISQSARADRHREIATRLLASGGAYRCFATPDEIAAARETARAERRPFRFQSAWRERSTGLPDAPFTVRLRAPRSGNTEIDDAVQGPVAWQNTELDDLILLRSDGSPTYMLAVVVDDHDMQVSHVIRGTDHLTNAARQSQIFDALGWPRPVFAHVPLIHGPDGAKYSKRHGAVGLREFEVQGYLPEAMRNYLVRLGWSHGDQEFFTTEELIRLFSLDSLNRSAARFDFAKLLSLNADHLRRLPDEELLDRLAAHLDGKAMISGEKRRKLASLMGELKPRVRSLAELAEMAGFILEDGPPDPDAKALKLLTSDNRLMLQRLTCALASVTVWDPANLETVVREFAESRDVGRGKIAQPMRAALTGKAASPGIFDVMSVLGQAAVIERLRAVDDGADSRATGIPQE